MLKTRLYSALAFLIAFTIGVGLGQLPLRRATHSEIPACSHPNKLSAQLTAVSISPDSRFVVSGDINGYVCLWEKRSKRLVWKNYLGGKVLSLDFSLNKPILAALTQNGHITTFNLKTGEIQLQSQPLPEIGIEGGALQYTVSDDPSAMVYGGAPLRSWATLNGRESRLHPFDSTATCITWSALSDRYALGNQSGIVKLYDKETFTEIRQWGTPFQSIQAVGLSPFGQWLAVTGDQGLGLIDLFSGNMVLPEINQPSTQHLTCIAFSKNDPILVTGSQDGMISIWSIPKYSDEVTFYSSDSWYAATCSHLHSPWGCSNPNHFPLPINFAH